MAATADAKWEDGLQLPFLAHTVISSVFSAANIGSVALHILDHGRRCHVACPHQPCQQERCMSPILEGLFFGTMH
jgi:hypothetical protein